VTQDAGTKGNTKKVSRIMNRNGLYLLIGALVIGIVVLGYYFYQEQQKTSGIDINVGESGISIETK
jgi:predicted negative regulator of RcsB-dependent stress response